MLQGGAEHGVGELGGLQRAAGARRCRPARRPTSPSTIPTTGPGGLPRTLVDANGKVTIRDWPTGTLVRADRVTSGPTCQYDQRPDRGRADRSAARTPDPDLERLAGTAFEYGAT